MATISPAVSVADGVPRVTWSGVSTADTMESFTIQGQGGLAASVQVTGTFGSSTVTLTGSNDDTNFVTLSDVNDDAISFTSAGMAEFSTAVGYIKPASTGGTADNVDVVVILRG